MKLKITPEIITFKLSQTEKKELTQPDDSLTNQILFPNDTTLSYTLRLVGENKNKLSYINNEIILEVPINDFATLDKPSKKGLIIDFGHRKASIEIDLRFEKK
jgi:hypothetical protein